MGRVEIAEMTQVETNLQMRVPEILLTPQVCRVGFKGSKRTNLQIGIAWDCEFSTGSHTFYHLALLWSTFRTLL